MRRYYTPEQSTQTPEAKTEDYRGAYHKVITELLSHGLTEVVRITDDPDRVPGNKFGYNLFVSPPQPRATLEDTYRFGAGRSELRSPFNRALVEQYVEVRFVSADDAESLGVPVELADNLEALLNPDGTEPPMVSVEFTDGQRNPDAPEYPVYAAVESAFGEPELARAS